MTPDPTANPRFRVPKPLRMSFQALCRIAPPVAARAAWFAFAKPPRKRHTDRYEVLGDARRITLSAEGEALAGYAWGEGPTVLLHHGWGSSALGMSAFVRPLVEAGYQVLAYDAHAHGKSTGVTTTGPVMARHLAQIAAEWDVERVVAHSMGVVVTAFAQHLEGFQPDRIALLNGPADMPFYFEGFSHAVGLSRNVQERVIRGFETESGLSWNDLIVEWVARGKTVPTLLIHDEEDPDVPWPHVERIRASWVNHHAITTAGLGHRGSLHHEPVIAATVDFLEGNMSRLPSAVAKASV